MSELFVTQKQQLVPFYFHQRFSILLRYSFLINKQVFRKMNAFKNPLGSLPQSVLRFQLSLTKTQLGMTGVTGLRMFESVQIDF